MERKHTDAQYEEKLRQIRERLLLMSGRVEQMIHQAVQALVERDEDKARRIIAMDAEIDRDEMETDDLCLVVLARWQPLATDLRFLTLALKMVTDLERIGDLAVNVCERVIWLGKRPPLKPYVDIPCMGEIVEGMLRDAVDAFVAADDKKAESVIARDGEVDELYRKVFLELLGIMHRSDDNIEPGLQVQSVAKLLERMADHCTNLAEQVIFMVRGEDVRHALKPNRQ